MLEIYDDGVRSEPTGIQLMMLDAAALPWRTHLRGLDVGTRWVELAGRYEEGDEGAFYAFNDMHAMMAFIATGRSAAAVARLAAMEAAAEGEGTAGRCTHEPQRCN